MGWHVRGGIARWRAQALGAIRTFNQEGARSPAQRCQWLAELVRGGKLACKSRGAFGRGGRAMSRRSGVFARDRPPRISCWLEDWYARPFLRRCAEALGNL